MEYIEDAHKWVCTMGEPSTGSLTANTPYLFMPSETTMTFPNISSMTGGVVTLQTTTDDNGIYGGATTEDPENWEFHGTYKGKTWTSSDSDKDYGFAATSGDAVHGEEVVAGQFVRLAPGAWMKPMRCYLTYVAPPSARRRVNGVAEELPQSITVRLVNRNDDATDIGTISIDNGQLTIDNEGAWYSLDGRKFSGKPSQKGIYINNGSKIIIK